MDIIEQITSIQYLVNTSKSKEDAEKKYSNLDGIFIPEVTANQVFNEAIDKKFNKQHIDTEKIIASVI